MLAEDGGPRFVLDIAWRQNHLARWTFDGSGRRHTRAVFLRLEDGTLFERKLTEWQYDDVEADGDPSVPRRTFTRAFDGRTEIYDRARNGCRGHTSKREPFEQFLRPAVAFEDWSAVLDGADIPAFAVSDAIEYLPSSLGRNDRGIPLCRIRVHTWTRS